MWYFHDFTDALLDSLGTTVLFSQNIVIKQYSVLVTQSCLTLCNPMDCSLPASSVHGILQARILEWIAMHFSRGCTRPRDWTCISCVSCVSRHALYHCTTWEAYLSNKDKVNKCLMLRRNFHLAAVAWWVTSSILQIILFKDQGWWTGIWMHSL